MNNTDRQFLNLFHNEFKNTFKQENISKRHNLFNLINGDLFYPLKLWPHKYITMFWKKPISDRETFELFLFFIGNGGSPQAIAEWILTSQAWTNENRKIEKRSRQLDFIFNNKDGKSNDWFYFDLHHQDYRFLNGIKRSC